MLEIIRWVGFVGGVALLLATWHSIIVTFILPRSVTSWMTFLTWRVVRAAFRWVAARRESYERKDRILALLGPIALLALLLVWMIAFVAGYALLFWPMVPQGFDRSVKLAGSSFFTLGVSAAPQGGPTAVEFIAAGSGMVVIALLIGYLPTLYGAYNRRETLVSILAGRVGSPQWGPDLLARHQQARAVSTLPKLFEQCEVWAADISESHVNHPWLLAFRSQDSKHSWIVSLTAMMDAAALWIAFAPESAPPEAQHCLRAGHVATSSIARLLKRSEPDSVAQESPDAAARTIRLPYPAFLRGAQVLTESGFPVERDAAAAWNDFQRWRSIYEADAATIADEITAAPAPWSGRRSELSHGEVHEFFDSRPAYLKADGEWEAPSSSSIPVGLASHTHPDNHDGHDGHDSHERQASLAGRDTQKRQSPIVTSGEPS